MKSDYEFTIGYYLRQYKSSIFHKRGDNPCVYSFWARYIRKLIKSGSLLEVGCGQGYFIKRISPYYITYGVDISKDGVESAKNVSKTTKFEICDASKLMFNDNYFEIVVSFDMVEHLLEPEKFFKEAFRVLKEKGLLIVKTPNPYSFGAKVKGQTWHGARDKSHVSILTPEEWRNIIKNTGFVIKEEGTDTLWDSPYFKVVPKLLQKLVFISAHYLLTNIKGFYPWKWGENYVCIAKKESV